MKEKRGKNSFLWHPRYWLSWMAIFKLWLISHLPYHWQLKIGKVLGLLAMKLMKSRARVSAINIGLCFSQYSKQQQQNLVRDSFIALGQGVLSSGMAWWASEKRLRKFIGNVQGIEYLQSAFARGNGVILLSAHFIADEIGARLVALLSEQALNVMHRKQTNDVFEFVLQKNRHRYLNKVIIRANVREMITVLKNNQAIFYLPDQNFEQEHSIFVPFMGVNALTLTATSRFAKINNCSVIPAFCFQRADGRGYDIEFLPALTDYPSDDQREDAVHVNKIFEHAIKRHPEQYMWLHRRFKIRPKGKPSFY